MNVWRRRVEWLAAIALLAPGVRTQDAAAEEVSALFQRGRWGAAYEECEHIESALLREQWRFHVLYASGNLPEALEAANAGLALEPRNLELLHNASLCSITLGLAGASLNHISRWRAALDSQPLDEPQREAWERKLAPLEQALKALQGAEQSARDARSRSRAVCAAGLAVAVATLLALAWVRAGSRG